MSLTLVLTFCLMVAIDCQSSDMSLDQSSNEPSGQLSNKFSDSSSNEFSESDQSLDMSSDQSSDMSSDQSSDMSSDQSSDMSSDQSSDMSSDQSSDMLSDQSSDMSSDQSSDMSSDQSSDMSSDQSSDMSSDQSSDMSSDQSSDMSSDQSSDMSSDQSSDMSSGQSSDQSLYQSSNMSSSENWPQRKRTRISNEIVPSSVECSTKNENDIRNGSAAVDLNFTTTATAMRGDSELAWIRLNFTEVYCISQVLRFNRDTSIRHSFVCGNAGCDCTGSNCDKWEIVIGSNSESINTDLPQCKYGNRVVLRATRWRISYSYFTELAVFGRLYLSDHSTAPEPVYWSLLLLLFLTSTTLAILLARQFNRCNSPAAEQMLQYIYKCCSSNNAEDEQDCNNDL